VIPVLRSWKASAVGIKFSPRRLILRHFEELNNAEVAQVLSIKPSAAVNR
jgi:hypothetical protein